MTDDEIGHAIIGAAMKVHSTVGPGLLESAYEACLTYELEKQEIAVRRQVSLPLRYEDLVIDNGYRIDLLVGDRVIVELKGGAGDFTGAPWTVAELPPARRIPVGLFIEFPCCTYAGGYCADAEWLLTLRIHRETFVSFVVNFASLGRTRPT
jgi:GxxExxY protein